MRIPARLHWMGTSGIFAFVLVSSGSPSLSFGQVLESIEIQKRPGFDVAEAAGLSAGVKPEVLTWDRVYALSIVQARTGGRLGLRNDLNSLATQAKSESVTDFARFRSEFLDPAGAFPDPSRRMLLLCQRFLAVDETRLEVATLERLVKVYGQLGNSTIVSGKAVTHLTQTAMQKARWHLSEQVTQLREVLDEFHVNLGIAPGAPVVPDLSILSAFREGFDAFDAWQQNPKRNLADLDTLGNRLPALDDILLDGRSLLALARADIDRPDDVLKAADKIVARRYAQVGPRMSQSRRVRSLIRKLISTARSYEIERQLHLLAAHELDRVFEEIIAPPAHKPSADTLMVSDLIPRKHDICVSRIRVVALWVEYQSERLALLRELGEFPFKDWASFYMALTPRPSQSPAPNPNGNPLKPSGLP